MVGHDAAATHAGAVTVRVTAQGREYLLVGPKSGKPEWLFPKGHIEEGEDPDRAALRELAEEAGARGLVLSEIGRSSFATESGKDATVRYFLVAFTASVPAQETRRAAWFPYAGAYALLSHEDARTHLDAAEALAKKALPADSGKGIASTLEKQLEFLNDRMKETSDTANQFLDRYMFGGLVGVVGLLNLDLVLLKERPNVSDPHTQLVMGAMACTVFLLSFIYFWQVQKHYTGHRLSHRKLKYKYELTLHCLLLGTNAADYGSQLEAKVDDPHQDEPTFLDDYPSDPNAVPGYLLAHHRKAAARVKPDRNMILVALLMVVLTMSVRLGGLLIQDSASTNPGAASDGKTAPAVEPGP